MDNHPCISCMKKQSIWIQQKCEMAVLVTSSLVVELLHYLFTLLETRSSFPSVNNHFIAFFFIRTAPTCCQMAFV